MEVFRTRGGVEKVVEFLQRLADLAAEPFMKNKENEGFPRNTGYIGTVSGSKGERVDLLHEALRHNMNFFVGLLKQNSTRLPPTPPPPKPPGLSIDIAAANSGWTQFERSRIIDIVASEAVVSVADALIKTTAVLSVIAGSMQAGQKRFVFRGQGNIEWELVPQLGRKLREEMKQGTWTVPEEPLHLQANPRELGALKSFQDKWPLATLDEIDERLGRPLENDAAWWVLMQHYSDAANLGGTRLLDITTSPLFALLFACVDWNTGSVKDGEGDSDGVIHCIVEGQGARVDDFAVSKPSEAMDFFNTTHDVPYMVFNPPHNERSKAQSGGFIWWPKFWEPLPQITTYHLRVPKENKKALAKELLSLGVGPKEAVRGKKGLQNEKMLRANLGLPAWNPLGVG